MMTVKTLTLSAIVLGARVLMTGPTASALQTPTWQITSVSTPTNLVPGDREQELTVTAVNAGGGATDGSAVTISDTLPAGVTATGALPERTGVIGEDAFPEALGQATLNCLPSAFVVTCTDSRTVDPGDVLTVRIPVSVEASVAPATLVNHVSVTGGGGAPILAYAPLAVSSMPAAPGIAPGSLAVGLSTMQAGAHPNLTTTFAFSTSAFAQVSSAPKDTRFDLPVGLVGNTVGMPRCPSASITASPGRCLADTIVGTAVLTGISASGGRDVTQFTSPVYNIAPAPGEPAAFAFYANETLVRLDTSVLSAGDYGVRVTAANLSENNEALAVSITIWGVPADHNGPGHDMPGTASGPFGGPSADVRVSLLSNPTQCSEPLSATLSTDAWTEPGVFRAQSVGLGTLSGCDEVPFASSMSMVPDTLEAGAPAGYHFDLTVHREQDSEPEGVAASDVKNVTVTLPVGTVISPSAATGLAACSDEQFFGPEPNRGLSHPATVGSCPPESQIGTVRITTPALEEALQGNIYLGAPLCDPCTPPDGQSGRMVRLFVQGTSEGEGGIVIKLEGTASINQQSGQITATFKNNPQLPFNDFKMTLTAGPRATLANPSVCGPATTSADLTPWSTPFTLDSAPTSTFDVMGCSVPQFDPSFTAGTTNNQAGAFSAFTVAFGRSGADEDLAGIQMQLPPGLLGMVASVPLCREPQAAEGTCGPESLIGTTQVLTGPGAEPFLVTGGQVFLTEGYKRAPYGLSIVVPAKAGPYTLSGSTGTGLVVVRAAINVNPTTAALTITSDSLPTILDGIPLALKVVNVTISRPAFTFNPTNCNKQAIGATLTSTQGAGAGESSSFQVTNCAALAFKPGFSVSTSGRTSKADGASLDVKVTYPPDSQSAEANIARVKVDLPKQLPSRLTTLQKACAAAVFEANPATCPAGSVIGIARAATPVLPVPLRGPVYFVSHGGEAFPLLVIILQGDGVRVDLTGTTFIKAGITSSTFGSVPDVPISSFELYLPEGPYSALAAPGDLCDASKTVTVKRKVTARVHGKIMERTVKRKLKEPASLLMPTEFVAQNGIVIHEYTTINVTECSMAKPHTKSRTARSARDRGGRHHEQ
jgi:hypothetical protein